MTLSYLHVWRNSNGSVLDLLRKLVDLLLHVLWHFGVHRAKTDTVVLQIKVLNARLQLLVYSLLDDVKGRRINAFHRTCQDGVWSEVRLIRIDANGVYVLALRGVDNAYTGTAGNLKDDVSAIIDFLSVQSDCPAPGR